jgi:hypothetical protein
LIKSALIRAVDGAHVAIRDALGESVPATGEVSLLTTDDFRLYGRFTTVNYNSAQAATQIVTPIAGGSLILTDLIVNARAVNGRSVQVILSDGTFSETLFDADITAPVSFGIAFGGRWRGWENASLRVTTDTTRELSIAVGYIKTPDGLAYAEWDALR